nr:MAG TPA: Major capsid protein [Microviridae sp.]
MYFTFTESEVLRLSRRRIRVKQSHFANVPTVNFRRSTFDRSNVYKTTFDSGKLIPFYVDEVIPGDTWNLKATCFARLSTPAVPFMDNLYFYTMFFFVPMRLVWENTEKFFGEQEDPDDSTDFLIPQLVISSEDIFNKVCARATLWDYFGLPTRKPSSFDNPMSVSVLYFRAYWKIWNDWIRDENLQDSVKINRSDENKIVKTEDDETVNGFSVFEPGPRGKRFDYFTGALPRPQKGEPVSLPLVGDAPIVSNGSSIKLAVDSPTGTQGYLAGNVISDHPGWIVNFGSYNDGEKHQLFAPSGGATGMKADLTSVTAATVNDLRQAFQIQRFMEMNARGGTRYVEFLKSQFGVVSPDARLQRSEYLGGSSSMVNINPVTQTSSTDSTTPQGNLAAIGVMGSRFHGFTKSFTEHGFIIGLCGVRADLSYQENINRMWLHKSIYDFALPVFAHLGEQPIYNKEIFVSGTSKDDEAFGFQERYGEYRYKPSLITGKLRSSDAQTLDVWHLSQSFTTLPTLSNEFIQDKPPIKRVLAVQDEPEFILDCMFNCKVTRCLPLYGVPGFIDHVF